ncbi:4224_t:CDS:1, partial [Acaulospora morrowiae]
RNNNDTHIAFVVDGETHTDHLQYIYCQLSKLEKAFVHIITTGKKRGLSGKKLSKENAQESNCNVLIHDLETLAISSGRDGIMTKVSLGMVQILDQIQPDILIY